MTARAALSALLQHVEAPAPALVPQGAPGVIVMAVYNGAAYLGQQLDSLAAQTEAGWDLIASDDGSGDGSLEILAARAQDWQGRHRLTVLSGPRQGFVRNFFHALRHVPPGTAWVALSDQDDVWFPEKLTRAQVALSRLPASQPALYCARSLICDAALRPLHPSRPFQRPAGFANALVQSVGGGNTMMLNRAALDLVRAALDEAGDAAAHDWWLYQIITACGGTIVQDPDPVLFYRQHGGNAIGTNTTLRGWIYRALFIMGRRFSVWNDTNLRALAACRHRFTPQAGRVLDHYAAARRGGVVARLLALHASGVYRQNRRGTLALFVACLLGRL